MPKALLSDKFCASVKPAEDRPQVDWFDEAVPGLILRVSGKTKTWQLFYSKPDGKRARLTLGRYPEIGLSDARQNARGQRGAVSEGRDPGAEKEARKAGQTISDLVESYIKRAIKDHRSKAAIARRLRKNVAGVIGSVLLADLHRRDLAKAFDKIEDRGRMTELRLVFSDTRRMLKWGVGRGALDRSPLEGVEPPKAEKPRDRWLEEWEIRQFWECLLAASMEENRKAVLRLCLATGCRVSEAAGLRLSELDFDAMTWEAPAERSKNGWAHLFPIGDLAASIIRGEVARKAEIGESIHDIVFPAENGEPIDGGTVARALKRSHRKIGLAEFSPHDLRRTFGTNLEGLGVPESTIARLMNHVSITKSTVTARHYLRSDYLPEMRRAVALWDGWLRGVVQPDAADVVPLRSA